MYITVLCRVVDNYGDIGVVWRLCKRLKVIRNDVELSLVVDNLYSFQKICKSVDVSKEFQCIQDIKVYDWNAFAFCHEAFSCADGERMSFILECFQCGRPEWMEQILFEEKLQRTVHIIMLDYLTAEKYAEDFHCLDSLTRSARVTKVNFMPGFTEHTGGLVIDEAWRNLPERLSETTGLIKPAKSPESTTPAEPASRPILVFTYERNWKPLAQALFHNYKAKGSRVLAAQGRGKQSFIQAFDSTMRECLEELDFLDQTEWDEMMKGCSALVIRGEESMSRACLSGIPFIWQAYPQSEEYQTVKVKALLERMKRHFVPEAFKIVRRVWLCFNQNENDVTPFEMQTACEEFFDNLEELVPGFYAFALDLRKNGDLAANLMTFIEKKYIIS